jgi:hypothetical protein
VQEGIAPAIDVAKAQRAVGLNVHASPLLFGNRRIIFERTSALGLPVMYQWPAKFALNALGLTVPLTLLARADEVVE